MTYRPSQRKTASKRNPKRCICQHNAQAPRTATSRGMKAYGHTAHAAVHLASCPHSELAVTTAKRSQAAKRKAKRLRG